MHVVLLSGCLVNEALYQQRLRETADRDGDGFAMEEECNDDDAAVSPAAEEVCNGIDDDCDGAVDYEAVDAAIWYTDRDGDGHGTGTQSTTSCEPVDGTSSMGGDCDDARADTYPGAPETPYDRVDQDCSGADLIDADGDGFDGEAAAGDDCDDLDDGVNPGAEDIPYDGVDQDCSGGDLADVDADGHAGELAGGADCDDERSDVHPDGVEDWHNGATDNDCDGDRGGATLEYGGTVWQGPVAGGQAGRRIVSPGDVDGDGLADLLTSAPFDPSWVPAGGAVMLLSTDAAGGLQVRSRAEGRVTDGFLGGDIAGGDADGDGVGDALIASTTANEAAGTVWLISGGHLSASPDVDVETDAQLTFRGSAAGAYAGSSVTLVGDVDGDGVTDVAVGAPLYDGARGTGAGAVSIIAGTERGTVHFDDTTVITGPYADAGVGNRAFPLGDQDGDGSDDFAVGISFGDILAIIAGGASSGALDEVETLRLKGAEDLLVTDAWPTGDIDGDGAIDLGVLLDNRDIRLFTDLLRSATLGVSDWSHTVTATQYVYQIGSVGDLDHDGRDEVLVPTIYDADAEVPIAGLFFGSDWAYRATTLLVDAPLLAVSTRTGAMGYRFTTPGDIDGDGVDEIAIAAYADSGGGVEAGAIALVPAPR